MTSSRDEFSKSTRTTLAERVSWKCSYPKCGQSTVGPASNDIAKRINNGIAAHICAAAENGPRFDPLMTSEARKDISNGIWMCRNHGNLIDADNSNYTVEQLRLWKEEAEQAAYVDLSGRPPATINQDPNEKNVALHREGVSQGFKDINFFRRYYSSSKGEIILQGFDAADFVISEQFISVFFNDWPTQRVRLEDHLYVDRVEIDFCAYVDDIVRLHDPHEHVHTFSFHYHINSSFSLRVSTGEAYYDGSYHIQSGIIYDDLDRRISPRKEGLYNKIMNRLSTLKRATRK